MFVIGSNIYFAEELNCPQSGNFHKNEFGSLSFSLVSCEQRYQNSIELSSYTAIPDFKICTNEGVFKWNVCLTPSRFNSVLETKIGNPSVSRKKTDQNQKSEFHKAWFPQKGVVRQCVCLFKGKSLKLLKYLHLERTLVLLNLFSNFKKKFNQVCKASGAVQLHHHILVRMTAIRKKLSFSSFQKFPA